MNKRIKQLWTKALRSGKFQQGKGNLCKRSNKGQLSYCCLGVLIKLYAEEHGLAKKDAKETVEQFKSKSNPGFPVAKVINWAGLHHSTTSTLANMNDGVGYIYKNKPQDFKKIAAYIDKKL